MSRAEDVDALAQEIRCVDGSNSLGAGALAEALMPFLAAAEQRGAEKALDFATFSPWLRNWCKNRFGKWITHNTATGARNDLLAAIRRGTP